MEALMSLEYLLEVVKHTIEKVDYCFVITLNESGQANARLVQHFKPEVDLIVWIGTSLKSRKVSEIRNKSGITITFQDDKDCSYVTMLGSASVENTLNEKQRHWQEDFIAYFPKGPQNDDYVLIKFIPSKIELMNFQRGVTPEPFGLQPAVLVKAEENWVVEEMGA